MAKLYAFKAYRPDEKLASKIASYPYDVINSDEARELVKDNPYSFLHVVKPEVDLDPAIDLYDDRVYAKGAENLKTMIQEKHLVQDEKECLYVYKQKMGDHEQYGLVGCASVEDYINDIIKKHELTRKDKEADRTRHVDTMNANAGPVFLTYRASSAVDGIVEKTIQETPVYDFTADDGIGHTVWKISDASTIQSLVQEFHNIPFLYVADGHHRSASAANVGIARKEKNANHTGEESYNKYLTVLFPDNQLKILAYNRVVKDLNGLSDDEFIQKVSEKFEIHDTNNPEPGTQHTFCMYLNGTWSRLVPKKGTFSENDPIESLDVSIAQTLIFDPLLGIKDPRTDHRINFIGGIRGTGELEKLVNNGDYKVAFSLYPTTVKNLMDVADAGKIMPPKSTWFEPKLRSGLLVHVYE